jgi:hypothetical protein
MKSGRWTSDEVHRLMDLRAAGRSYDDIGAEMHRKPAACAWRHSEEQRKRGVARVRAFNELAEFSRRYEALQESKRAATVAQHAAPSTEGVRSARPQIRRSVIAEEVLSSCHTVRDGVDVRDIAERGITAVLLGDPQPGRSALDERRRS